MEKMKKMFSLSAFSAMTDSNRDIYNECIANQLEEVSFISSMYSSPGETSITDPDVISNFNDFLHTPQADPAIALKAHLDFTLCLKICQDNETKVDMHFELPHLYPKLENAIVVVRSSILNKAREHNLKAEIEQFILNVDKTDGYLFQVISWIQGKMQDFVDEDMSKREDTTKTQKAEDELVEFERLWIYSHHIKSSTKRQEIIKQSRNLDLSGFSRPGKPGIICVEGLHENTQEFWRIIKAMRWQKISICKNEISLRARSKIDRMRRFEGFKEQLFCNDLNNDEGIMDMSSFIKYLEAHNSGYMKMELFGIDVAPKK